MPYRKGLHIDRLDRYAPTEPSQVLVPLVKRFPQLSCAKVLDFST